MTRRLAIFAFVIVTLLALSPLVRRAGRALSQPHPATGAASVPAPSTSFRLVDVFVDAGDQPLAAYQFEFWGESGVKLVGIEGGEHAAFRDPPRYDPRALTRPEPRAIVAAFDTGKDLPTGRTRVARLMVQVEVARPVYHVNLHVAASPDARPIPRATISFAEGAQP